MGYFILVLTMVVYLLRPAEWIPFLDFRWNLLLNAIGAVIIAATVISKGKDLTADRTSAYLCCFLVGMVLSSMLLGQFYAIGGYFLQMVTNIIVFMLVQLTIQSRQRMHQFIFILIMLLLFICYQCYLQYSVGENWGGLPPIYRKLMSEASLGGETILEPQVTWFGILNDPNDLGMLLIAFVPYMFYQVFFSAKNPVSKLGWVITLSVIIYITILTNSRGSMLALIGSIGFFFILKTRSVWGLVLAGLAGALILVVGPSRMAELTSGDASALERVYAWALALDLFTMNPVTGIGAEQFLEHHYKTTHNSYVLAFAETGMLGFYFYCAIFATALFTCIKVAFAEEDKALSLEIIALTCGLVGIMISIFFISRTYVLLPFLYIAILMTYTRVSSPQLFAEYIPMLNKKYLGLIACSFIIFIYLVNRLATSIFVH